MMHRVFTFLWLGLGSAATLAVLWATSWPLGVPDEWVWLRLLTHADTGLNLALAVIGSVVYLTVVWVGGTRLMTDGVTRLETGAWVLVLAASAFGWLWCVQETAPAAGQLGKAPFVLFYPGASGYFTHVRSVEPNPQKFLAGYEALMEQGDVLHVGTHPPGLFCAFYGFAWLVDAVPALTPWLLDTQPESVREAFVQIATNTARTPHPLQPRDAAILWLAALVAMACAAGTVIPLFGLFRWTLSRPGAFAAAALWPAVPAAAVFLPKSDAAYPLLSTLVVWAVVATWRKPSLPGGVVAGLLAWLGLFCSLAFLPVYAFAGCWCAVDWWQTESSQRRATLLARGPTLLAAVLGFSTPIVALWFATGMNLPNVWWWNYRNHAGFYAQFTRTYALWLCENPLELGFAVGWPIMGAALWIAARWLAARERSGRTRAVLVGGGVWLLLWLTGKNSGEAARLWLLLMPGVVWLAAHFADPEPAAGLTYPEPAYRRQLALLAVALVVCTFTVHRVSGFHME
jgi:hypothetical protein